MTARFPERAFFGRRKGHRLRRHHVALVDTLLPQLAFQLDDRPPRHLASLFPRPVESVRLEIGFGGGEHLAAEAAANRAIGFIGCEPYVNGMAKVLALIEAHALDNLRLHGGDAMSLLAWLPAASLERIDLLYPDPWPKRRHWKRRFVQDASIVMMARVLRPGGLFRFASDVADYADWTLTRLARSAAFVRAGEDMDWHQPWPGFGGTRYEAKARRAGRVPHYLAFRRLDAARD